jgi:hypothetical protein
MVLKTATIVYADGSKVDIAKIEAEPGYSTLVPRVVSVSSVFSYAQKACADISGINTDLVEGTLPR